MRHDLTASQIEFETGFVNNNYHRTVMLDTYLILYHTLLPVECTPGRLHIVYIRLADRPAAANKGEAYSVATIV